jgi:hypothetical protein
VLATSALMALGVLSAAPSAQAASTRVVCVSTGYDTAWPGTVAWLKPPNYTYFSTSAIYEYGGKGYLEACFWGLPVAVGSQFQYGLVGWGNTVYMTMPAGTDVYRAWF